MHSQHVRRNGERFVSFSRLREIEREEDEESPTRASPLCGKLFRILPRFIHFGVLG